MIYNELPFWSETELGILEKIHSTDLKLPSTREVNDGLKRLLLRMLDKNPLTRATMEELKRDPWLNEGYAVSLESREADIIANITEEELLKTGIAPQAIIFARALAKKWLRQDAIHKTNETFSKVHPQASHPDGTPKPSLGNGNEEFKTQASVLI